MYVTAKLASGDYLTDTMTTEEINAIRDKSRHIAFSFRFWLSVQYLE